MSQVNAGDVISLTINGEAVCIKIEDASKSETIFGKVEASQSVDYQLGQVYEFDRQLLRT